MNLLVITQKVDKKDSVLGAYHRWVEEFSKHYESVIIICLYKGEYNLPSNVKVLSLGKESSPSRINYLKLFYKYIWQERKNYDRVFVHMNEEYVLLAGMWWRLSGKKIGMFRNHVHGTWKTPLAVWLSSVVFCTSPHSYTARFKKTKIVPAGTDITKYRLTQDSKRVPRSILSIGRIDPVKNIDVLIKSLYILDEEGFDFVANIVGDPDPKNIDYYEGLKQDASDLIEKKKVVFHKAVPNPETPKFYQSHEVYVNLTNSGSLDKTVLSAMVSKTIPVISNVSFKGVVDDRLIFEEKNPEDLANKLKFALALDIEERSRITDSLKLYVEENHSLEKTISLINQSLE